MKMAKQNTSRMHLPNIKTNFVIRIPKLFKTDVVPTLMKGRGPKHTEKDKDKAKEVSARSPVSSVRAAGSPAHKSQKGSVIYKGTKYFWRTRCNLDITIIDHVAFHCVEVIAYNARTDQEAPRIYLDSQVLLGKADEKELVDKAEVEKENCLRTRKSFIWETLLAESQQNFIIQYILARLNMTAEGNEFDIYLNQLYSDQIDVTTGKLDTICQKPLALMPHPNQTKKFIPLDELKKGLEDLHQERTIVGTQFAAVQKLMTEARSVLGLNTKSRDDSFTFSPSRRRSQVFPRSSIDDSHVMENTGPSSLPSLVSHALIAARNAACMADAHSTAENLVVLVDKTTTCSTLVTRNGPGSNNKFVRHRSHNHGLKYVNSWGSMNKLNEALALEEENMKLKDISLIKPTGKDVQETTMEEEDMILKDISLIKPAGKGVRFCVEEKRSITKRKDSVSPRSEEDDAISPKETIKKAGSKRILSRAKSNKKVHLKIISKSS
jgi:hypothetical protein